MGPDLLLNRWGEAPVDPQGVAAQHGPEGVVVQVELGDGAGVGGDAGGAGPVAAEDASSGQAVEVEAGEVGGEEGGGEAGEVDPDVGANQGEDGGGVAEAVDGTGEGSGAGVEHHRHPQLGAALVDQVEDALGGCEAAVDRVQLDRGRAKGELAVQLVGDRVVQVGVEAGDGPEPARVVLDQGQEVLDGLDPGDPGAVLAHQQGDVDALGLQVGVEAVGTQRARLVVQVVEGDAPAELERPALPVDLEGGPPGRVQVDVDQRDAVDHPTVRAGGTAAAPESPAGVPRSLKRWILPVVVLGSSSVYSTMCGNSWRCSRSLHQAWSSGVSRPASASGATTTALILVSPSTRTWTTAHS